MSETKSLPFFLCASGFYQEAASAAAILTFRPFLLLVPHAVLGAFIKHDVNVTGRAGGRESGQALNPPRIA
jgi:hypothetical protein